MQKKIKIPGGCVDLIKERKAFELIKKRMKRIAQGKPNLNDFKY